MLGSTGSIGTQALDVIEKCGMTALAITANRSVELLEKQIRKASTRDKKKETTEKKQDKQKDGRVYFDIRGPPSDSEVRN